MEIDILQRRPKEKSTEIRRNHSIWICIRGEINERNKERKIMCKERENDKFLLS